MKIRLRKIALTIAIYFAFFLEVIFASSYGTTTNSISMACPNGNIVRFEKGQIFTTVKVFSSNGHLLADVPDVEWESVPDRSTTSCAKFPEGHNLIFSFYGLGGSAGGIQIVGIDSSNKQSKLLIKKTFGPFLYDKSKNEWLGVGIGFYVYRGEFLWDNKNHRINLLVKRVARCNVAENASDSVIGTSLLRCLRSTEKATKIVGKTY